MPPAFFASKKNAGPRQLLKACAISSRPTGTSPCKRKCRYPRFWHTWATCSKLCSTPDATTALTVVKHHPHPVGEPHPLDPLIQGIGDAKEPVKAREGVGEAVRKGLAGLLGTSLSKAKMSTFYRSNPRWVVRTPSHRSGSG